LAGQFLRVTRFIVVNLPVKYVHRNNSPILVDEAVYLYLYRYLTRNRGVALCNLLFYSRPPFPRPPRSSPRSMTIALSYIEFLPSLRGLLSSLAGAVLAGASCGRVLRISASEVIAVEGVCGATGAARGLSGVR
jgi:hypothetical protein